MHSDQVRPMLDIVSPFPTLGTAHPKLHLPTCSSFLSSIQHDNQSPNHSFLTTMFCRHSFPTSLPFPSSVRSLLQHEEANCSPLKPYIPCAPTQLLPIVIIKAERRPPKHNPTPPSLLNLSIENILSYTITCTTSPLNLPLPCATVSLMSHSHQRLVKDPANIFHYNQAATSFSSPFASTVLCNLLIVVAFLISRQ